MRKVYALVLVLVFSLSLCSCGGLSIPTEDGGKMKFSKDGIVIEGSDGSKATLAGDGEGLVMESSQGEVKVGEDLDLPEDYPEDLVPLYKKKSITSSAASSETGEFSIIYTTEASVDDIIEFYSDVLKDAEDKVETKSETGGIVSGILDNRNIAVIITVNGDDIAVAISIGPEISE